MLDIQNEINVPTPLIEIREELFEQKKIRVYVKADYLTHPQLAGNKWRKIKYNLLAASDLGKAKILSFGGAYSNHVYALGGIAKYSDFEVNCVIRGDELTHLSNDTLQYAHQNGVKLHFVSRIDYRNKEKLIRDFGESFYVLPEGGTNKAALMGVSEMVDEIVSDIEPDIILAAMGTGGTVAGVLSNEKYQGRVIGIPVLKGGSGLINEVNRLVEYNPSRLEILTDFHEGGYGKFTNELKDFAAGFNKQYAIELDIIYTAKLFKAVYTLIRNDYFSPNHQLVIYHSGGLRL